MKKVTLLLLVFSFTFFSCKDYYEKEKIEAINKKTEEYYLKLYGATIGDAASQKDIFPESVDTIKIILDSIKKEDPFLANDFIREKWELYKRIDDSVSNKNTKSSIMQNKAKVAKIVSNRNFESNLSNWDGSLPSLVDFTKENLHNPDSFEHVKTGYIVRNDFIQVQMIYRGRNAYNALVKGSITAKVDGNGNLLEIISSQ